MQTKLYSWSSKISLNIIIIIIIIIIVVVVLDF